MLLDFVHLIMTGWILHILLWACIYLINFSLIGSYGLSEIHLIGILLFFMLKYRVSCHVFVSVFLTLMPKTASRKILYSCKFIVLADNKNLIPIFASKKGILAYMTSRLLHWATMLPSHIFNIKYPLTNTSQSVTT